MDKNDILEAWYRPWWLGLGLLSTAKWYSYAAPGEKK